MFTPNSKGYFLELSPYSVLMARTLGIQQPLVIEDLREAPLDNAAAVTELLTSFFPAQAAGPAGVVCSVYSQPSLAHRATAEEARLWTALDQLDDFIASTPYAAMRPCEFAWVDARSGGQPRADAPWLLTGTPGSSRTAILDKLSNWKLSPLRIQSAALAAAGTVAGAAATTLICELGDDSSLLYLVGPDGVESVRPAATGMATIVATIQQELKLKFKGSAAKLFFNESYDFTELGPKIVAALAPALQSGLAALVSAGGRAPSSLLLTAMPSKQQWLAQTLAPALGLQPLTVDFGAWCATNRVSFSNDTLLQTLAPGWLGFLGMIGRFQNTTENGAPWQPAWFQSGSAPAASEPVLPVPARIAPPEPKTAVRMPNPIERVSATSDSAAPIPVAVAAQAQVAVKNPAMVPFEVAALAPKPAINKSSPARPEVVAYAPGTQPVPAPAATPTPASTPEIKTYAPQRKTGTPTPMSPAITPTPAARKKSPTVPPFPFTPVTVVTPPATRLPQPTRQPVTPPPAPVTVQQPVKPPFFKSVGFMAAVGALVVIVGLSYYLHESAVHKEQAAHEVQLQQQAREAEAKRIAEQKAREDRAKKAAEEQDRQRRETEAANARQAAEEQDRQRLLIEHMANARGSLILQTSPAGAHVQIGSIAADSGPAEIKDLKIGVYTATISLPGYEDQKVDVIIKENEVFNPGLITLARSTGQVEVDSDPSGLDFELTPEGSFNLNLGGTNSLQGKTPATLDAVPVGRYTIVTHRAGWPDTRDTVQVARNETSHTTTRFHGGMVRITSKPTNAKIVLNGMILGETPLTLTNQSPGDVHYEITATNCIPVDISGTVTAGNTLSLNATLLEDVDRIVESSSELDEKPVPIHTLKPTIDYTKKFDDQSAILSLVVDREGNTRDVIVMEATSPSFGQNCISAIAQWKFKPGMIKGRAYNVRVKIPFKLQGLDH